MALEGAGFLYAKPDCTPRVVPRTANWLSQEEGVRFLFEGPGMLRYDRPIKAGIQFMVGGCMTHDKPVAYFMTHGTKDGTCTYPQYGVPQLQDFAKVNGCMTATLPTPTSSASACIDFQGCSLGHPTRSCLFVGDHTPSPGGTMTTWVPAETWKFIAQF